jgi:GR25 family glycosyltransferase involved in LPS biosynthesis/glycosyltransferase involved in cell wall biosynthesis
MTRNEETRQGTQKNADRVHTIGLCMIVKNEAQVITRCLDSVKGLVDYVLIEDTGSTDGTQQAIRDWLKRENKPGDVIEEPWQSFAYNRSHVMAKLRAVEGVDYALIIDADDRIVLDNDFQADAWKAAMDVDLYDVRIRHGGARFSRPQICSNRKSFYFKAVLHEYLEGPPEGFTRKDADGFYIQTGSGGARNKNPRKYQDDAAALEKALLTETDPFLISRYTFYLAQSYRDCGEKELALKNYLKRAEAGYWIEEVFESLYGAAKMKDALDHPEDEVIAAYLKATDTLPTRAEALHGAAKFCRAKGRNEEGYQYAKRGVAIARPTTGLFVEGWVYDYGLLDELAVNAYWSGHERDSLDASLKLLSGNTLPENQRPRILANARFALDKLPKEPNLGEAGKKSLLDHHAMAPARPLRGRVVGIPRVLIAILAKQKEEMLPLYLECVEALDYPKSQIVLYIRTNNNTDRTEPILREWIERVRPLYADIEFDARDVAEQVQQFGAHEWNATRFKVLGEIRNLSMRRALDKNCDYYFVADVDNFIRPGTLRELVALELPIVSPLLRSIERGRYYSNYHAEVDKNGYFLSNDQYMWILNQWIRGVVEVPVVHTTYLVRADVISDLNYVDTTGRHEYVIFSDTARKAQIPQYLDNRQVYGYIAFGKGSDQYVEGGIERARDFLKVAFEGDEKAGKPAATTRPLVFSCFGQHGSGSTWMFNLARDVCKTKSIPFTSIHRDWSINLPWQTPGVRVIVAKSQNPMADFQAFVANSLDPVVITVRDPRDAVVSFMQRFSNSLAKSFDEALAAIALSAERLVAIKRLRDVPVFRYEDGFVGAQSTIEKVAELLGVRLSEQEASEVLANLEPDAVRKKIGELEKSGVIKTEADWDRESQWHKGHVGDGKVGKWRDVLTQEQEREILDRTKDYCETFGYAPPDKTPDLAKIAQAASQAQRSVSKEELAAVCEIHLINLDRSKDRLAKFMARNGHLGNVIRVPAVDGRETDREELQARGLIAADLSYTPGALGCALSHIALWQKAVAESRIITIFEDDAVSSINFAEGAALALALVPQDWDLIHWGCVFDPLFVWLDFDYVRATLHFYDRRFRDDLNAFQREGFSPTPVKLLHSFGTQAYSVSPKGAKTLLDACVPLQRRHITFSGAGVVTRDEGIDVAMDGAYPSMKAFLTLPPLVIQDRTLTSDRKDESKQVPG